MENNNNIITNQTNTKDNVTKEVEKSNLTLRLNIAMLVLSLVNYGIFLIVIIAAAINSKKYNAFSLTLIVLILIWIALFILGILLIVFYKKGETKGLNISNGIVAIVGAIIPFVKFALVILT